MSEKIVQLNEEIIKGQIKELFRAADYFVSYIPILNVFMYSSRRAKFSHI